MPRRPGSITLVGWLFILTGSLGLLKDWLPLLSPQAPARLAELTAAEGPGMLAFIWAVRLAAVVGGAFVLRGSNWARWLLLAWMAFHVALSAGHSTVELLLHVVVFVPVSWMLFRPAAASYFRPDQAAMTAGS
jgi:hypothetical protein